MNTTGTVFSSNYAPFGEQNGATGTDPTYKYTGKPQDGVGLYYYGARYYDPQIGRFITRDPAGPILSDPQNLNQYEYADDSPESNVDPNGQASMAVSMNRSSCSNDFFSWDHWKCTFSPSAIVAQVKTTPSPAGLIATGAIASYETGSLIYTQLTRPSDPPVSPRVSTTGPVVISPSTGYSSANPGDEYWDTTPRLGGGKPHEQPRYPDEDNRHPKIRPATNDTKPTVAKIVGCGIVGAIMVGSTEFVTAQFDANNWAFDVAGGVGGFAICAKWT
jgi:RHS repeat-associated protein